MNNVIEKQITIAASDYADKRCDEDEELSFNQLLDAFEDGAKWLKNNWHSPKEEPTLDGSHFILIEWYENVAGRKDTKNYDIVKNDHVYWSSVLSTYSIVTRWRYLEEVI